MRTLRSLLAVAAVLVAVSCGHPVLKAGPQPDGEHIVVRGHLYDLAGNRPGCFRDDPNSPVVTFYSDVSTDMLGTGIEVPC